MKNNSSAVKVLLMILIVIIFPIGIYLFWNFGNVMQKVGSVTDYATVYSYRIAGKTLYRYEIRNDEGVIDRSDISVAVPYIWQEGDQVRLHVKEDGEVYIFDYDLPTGTFTRSTADYVFLDPFSKIQKVKTVKLDTNCKNALVYDISAQGEPSWLWYATESGDKTGLNLFASKSEDENCWGWSEESTTAPRVETYDDGFTIFYTQDGLSLCKEFDTKNRSSSYEYALFEDGRVYVEQAIDTMQPEDYPDDTAKTSDFVNTEPIEIADCNAAYLRAKAEVTIPYDLVTFRANVDLRAMKMSYWAVTFSQKNDPTNGTYQTVHMDGEGRTICVETSSAE